MDPLNLKKGVSFELKKAITRVFVSAGWDVADKPGEQFDLDLFVVGLTQTPQGSRIFGNGDHVVVYANGGLKKYPDGRFGSIDGLITHSGDNRTGVTGDVAEKIEVDLEHLPAVLDEIAVFISIYDAVARKQNFGRVNNSFVRITNAVTAEDLCQYYPQKEFSDSTIVQIGSLIKDNGIWSFKAVGAGSGAGADINSVLAAY